MSFYSAKSQNLSLISTSPLSSSSSSFPSPCTIGSLRREFLSSGHSLRPPGLRCRRKWKKLGFQVHTPRLVLRASLSSQSMLVLVSVVTVSALTVVYLNFTERKKKSSKEMLVPEDLQWNRSVDENKDQVIEMSGSHETQDKVASLQVNEKALMHEETLVSDTSLSPTFDISTCNSTELVSSRNSEVTDLSSLPSLLPGSVALPITFITKRDEMHLAGYELDVKSSSELGMLMSETEITAATVPPNDSVTGVDELYEPSHEIVEEVEIGTYDGIGGDSVRRELYTFYESNQSAMRSLENFNGLNRASSRASFGETKSFSTLTRSSKIGAKFSTQDVLHTAG